MNNFGKFIFKSKKYRVTALNKKLYSKDWVEVIPGRFIQLIAYPEGTRTAYILYIFDENNRLIRVRRTNVIALAKYGELIIEREEVCE